MSDINLDRPRFFTALLAATMTAIDPQARERWNALASTDGHRSHTAEKHDAEAIEQITARLREADHRSGGGAVRTDAVTALGDALALQDFSCQEHVRARLRLATADLAALAAWTAYDEERYEQALNLWLVAGSLAEDTDHPRRDDLMIKILLDRAHLHLHQQEITLAQHDVREAQERVAQRPQHVSGLTHGYIMTVRAWCEAATGQIVASQRTDEQAQEIYAKADRATAPSWTEFLTHAELAAQRGHLHLLLATTHPEHASVAIDYFVQAISGYGDAYARSTAVNLPNLASAYFHCGDTNAAIGTGFAAVAAASEMSSQRVASRLLQLDAVAAAHQHVFGVQDLRRRIRTVASAIRGSGL